MVRQPTIFNTRDHRHRQHQTADGSDPFTEVREGTVSEMVDSRISMFTEMGFTSAQAEEAIKASKGDVNEALNILTGGQTCDQLY